MAVTTLVREWRHVDVRDLVIAILGRLPGIAVGIWLLVIATQRVLGILVGAIVTVAALLQWRSIRLENTTTNVVVAGFLSGTSATVSGVGGPPLAMVLSGLPGVCGPRWRPSSASGPRSRWPASPSPDA